MCPFISAINPKARSAYMIAVCVAVCAVKNITIYACMDAVSFQLS